MPRSASARIHPTAIVSDEAVIGDEVTVGPYSIIEGHVTLGPGCQIGPYVQLIGTLTMGQGNQVHAGTVLGDKPQHLGYKGEPTRTEIGDFNIFREHVTVHRGMPTTQVTKIGNHNFFMANTHVAHDCRIGNHCIFVNGSLLGGHAEISDRALVSGNGAVHQFCRVGRMALVGGTCAITQDLPPFFLVQDGINAVRGINVVGLRRAGIPPSTIQAINRAYRLINRSGMTITSALEQLQQEYGSIPEIQELIEFIRSSKRGICTGRNRSDEADVV